MIDMTIDFKVPAKNKPNDKFEVHLNNLSLIEFTNVVTLLKSIFDHGQFKNAGDLSESLKLDNIMKLIK